MPLKQTAITLKSERPLQIHDLTEAVRRFTAESGVRDGLLIAASRHTTMGVVINEKCEFLERDMIRFLEKLVPAQADYEHNRHAVDGRPNAHSHLLSLVIPSELTLVIAGGELQLGTWQSVFAVELDGPRPTRKIHLTVFSA
ncbi:MAG TPA: secondary thiamine-phosphate synthase enzyme YjbQ [bacterium]|nr:secondary thiamine-phosphate synthase enzyme YjbQ [bacterium]